MGALSSLSLKSNGLLNKESGEALVGVLKANSVLTELDISSNFDQYNATSQDGAGFAQALAVGLIDNGALLVLSLKDNGLGTEEGGKVIGGMLKGNSVLKELGLSGNGVCPASENSPKFVVALSPGLTDNGTLTKLDISSNYIAAAQGEDLQRICATGGIELAK
jgi:hypothetical protein